MTLAMVEALQDLIDPERNQHGLINPASLGEHGWLGSSSTSGRADDRPRASGDVTIARMPEPAIHYHSRTGGAMIHEPQSGDPSPGTWGPRVADEDLDLVIRDLYPARGLRIEGRRYFAAEH